MYFVSLRINTVYIAVTYNIFEFKKHKIIDYLILKDTKLHEAYEFRVSLINFHKELYPHRI